MKETPKWVTNVTAILGVIFVVLKIWNPELFTDELAEAILNGVGMIITVVLSIIAAFGAKDKLTMENFMKIHQK